MQVAALADHAYRTTPYYRRVFDERGLSPADIRTTGDLAKLPVLTKDDIRANIDDLVSSRANRKKMRRIGTSGSTGAPLSLLTSADALAFKWAVWWRHRARFGIHRGTTHVKFNTKPAVPPQAARPPYWRWDWREHQAAVPMQQIVPPKIEAISRFLDTNPFTFYAAYPSIIHSLAVLAAAQDIALDNGPRIIFSGAERMFDHQRKDVERYTGAEVSELYSFNEGAGSASMCEDGRLHEDFEFGVLECVDPEPDDSGRFVEGRVVATGLSSWDFPLMRYEVGDVGLWYPDDYVCSCGRGSRVIDSIVGRWEDYIVTPDGHQARRLGEIFKELPPLRQFQVVQQSPARLLLRLVVDPSYSEHEEDLLRRRVAMWISSSLEVDFEYPDRIEPGPGGKYQRIVNRMAAD